MNVYTVQAGDTLETIAKKFLVSVTDLQKWNNGQFPSLYSTTLPMTPGWVINVSPPSRTTYNVTDFGAIGHDITRNDGSVIAGSTSFVSKDGTFKSGDVGTNIIVDYAATNTTLSDMLIQGASYSLLTVNPLTTEIASGANVVVQFGTYTQTFVAAAAAPVGAIYVTVTAQTANYSYPIGSYVDPANLVTTITSVSSPTLITLGADATITAYGLTYTYTPDDTVALQDVYNTAAAEGGGTISLPVGVFMSKGITVDSATVNWTGIPGGGSVIKASTSTVPFSVTGAINVNNIAFDGGGIAANAVVQSVPTEGSYPSYWANVIWRNATSYQYINDGCEDTTYLNCETPGNEGDPSTIPPAIQIKVSQGAVRFIGGALFGKCDLSYQQIYLSGVTLGPIYIENSGASATTVLQLDGCYVYDDGVGVSQCISTSTNLTNISGSGNYFISTNTSWVTGNLPDGANIILTNSVFVYTPTSTDTLYAVSVSGAGTVSINGYSLAVGTATFAVFNAINNATTALTIVENNGAVYISDYFYIGKPGTTFAYITGHGNMYLSGDLHLNNATTMSSGSGSPTIAGTAGDYYFRTDAPTTSDERIYICTATGVAGSATWAGIV